ncbi:MAG: hypothetical protein Q9213_002550 [Squamulea squamosa]
MDILLNQEIQIGGSLTGLMHGIMLIRSGYNVRILEQDVGSPQSHMAGIGVAQDVLDFLERFDHVKQPLGIPSECLQSMDHDGKVTVFLKATRIMTSWDVLYHRLRANFDRVTIVDRRQPAGIRGKGLGDAIYDTGKQVVNIDTNEGKVSVRVQDIATRTEHLMHADLLLGADGSHSIVRRTFVPDSEARPTYAGYVAWRGVAKESDVSLATRRIFQKNVTYFQLPGEHVIV